MRIERVEAFPVRLRRDPQRVVGGAGSPHRLEGGRGSYQWSRHYPALYSTEFESCLVRVTLEDGTVGWGEAQAPLAPGVAAEIVKELLAVAVEGEEYGPDLETMRRLWERMYATMRVRGQMGGFMLDAMAGVDVALWDIAVQMQGKALRWLLNPAGRERVPAYVSGTPGRTVGERLEFVGRWWEAGFRVFKLYYESDFEVLLEQVDRMQEEFEGVQVAVDALWHLPEDRAVEYAGELAERRVLWLECPLLPEDVEGHVELVKETGVRLALGESYRTRFEARRFFDSGVMTYWQPDLGRSGVTETLELARRAREAGVAIVPHVSIALPPQLNAAVEVAAALGNCPLCEFTPLVVEMANRFVEEPGFVMGEGCYEMAVIEPRLEGAI
ncbi:MAG: mandelate racemase/muconate lactonizing enzyme family protein [Acidobacteriota bacterium]